MTHSLIALSNERARGDEKGAKIVSITNLASERRNRFLSAREEEMVLWTSPPPRRTAITRDRAECGMGVAGNFAFGIARYARDKKWTGLTPYSGERLSLVHKYFIHENDTKMFERGAAA